MSVSLVTALAAKEVMVSTLGTLYSIAADEDNEQPLQVYLRQDPSFTPLVCSWFDDVRSYLSAMFCGYGRIQT